MPAKKDMAGKRYSAERREELLALLEKRTGSIASFAKAHGVSAAALYKWQDHQAGAPSGFVEITRQGSKAPAGPQMRVQVGRVCLSFEGLPDVDWLASLAQKLQG